LKLAVITVAEGKRKGQEEKVGRRGLVAAGLLVAAMTLPMAPAARAATVFDDFDGPAGASPDSDKWDVVEGTGWDSGVEDYSWDNAVLDGNGNLTIQARKTEDGYTSGRVQTKGKESFGYGTLIARIKMPSGRGLWPSFWLVGADEDSNPWPVAGEIDVVELVSDPTTQYSSIHGPMAHAWDSLQDQIITRGADLSGDFHDYWITRSADSITVGVDDTKWGTFTPDSLPAGATWVFNKPFYVILNLAVGGGWAGLPDGKTDFPATMLVDWVNWEPA
jgi:beta-glucanase (GH16 family)